MIEHDPASPEFRRGVQESVGPRLAPAQTSAGAFANDDLGLWRDVFVQQKLPWGRFVQSAVIHTAAVGLIWGLSIAWLRQQKILTSSAFDRSSLVTYSPEEYLPPLDTGSAAVPQEQTGEPAFARQPILSVPREADNHTQTIVVPPDLKLDHDVPLPNIVATGAVVPEVPLDATRSASNRVVAPDTHVIAPAPDADFMRNKNQMALKSDVIPPPPDVRHDRERSVAGPETAVVAPPPELTTTAKGHSGALNIGASQVVAPAPQLTLDEQHTQASHGRGAKGGMPGGVEAVGPPPSVAASGGGGRQGRLIALGIHPVAPDWPGSRARGESPGIICRQSAGEARRSRNAQCGGIEIGCLQRPWRQFPPGRPACGLRSRSNRSHRAKRQITEWRWRRERRRRARRSQPVVHRPDAWAEAHRRRPCPTTKSPMSITRFLETAAFMR